MMVDLQVAETPWTTRVEGLGTLGYQIVSNISIPIPLVEHKAPRPQVTYMEQGGQLPCLHIPARPLCAYQARNFCWLHVWIVPDNVC